MTRSFSAWHIYVPAWDNSAKAINNVLLSKTRTPETFGKSHVIFGFRSLLAKQGIMSESPIKILKGPKEESVVNSRTECTCSSADDEIVPAVLVAVQV